MGSPGMLCNLDQKFLCEPELKRASKLTGTENVVEDCERSLHTMDKE